MKKLLLLFVGLAVFASCEKEPETEQPNEEPEYDVSLAGTTWTVLSHWDNFEDGVGGWEKLELAFAPTTVDFTCTDYPYGFGKEAGEAWGFTGTYTYYPPEITITVTSPEHLAGEIYSGTSEDKFLALTIIRHAIRSRSDDETGSESIGKQ